MLAKVWARVKEPSTWAGMAAIGIAFGVDASIMDAVVKFILAGFGVVAVFLPEGKA